jgi:hypothetical protein
MLKYFTTHDMFTANGLLVKAGRYISTLQQEFDGPVTVRRSAAFTIQK